MPNSVHYVTLPGEAEAPIRIFVNGEQREEGQGFVVDGRRLRFEPPLRAQPKLGLRQRTMLAMGIGVYGDLKGDTLDIQYQVGNATRILTVKLEPTPPEGPRQG
ncbi:MAG: hypothetical protein AB7V42_02725 [Thermoleophilia bacterium]